MLDRARLVLLAAECVRAVFSASQRVGALLLAAERVRPGLFATERVRALLLAAEAVLAMLLATRELVVLTFVRHDGLSLVRRTYRVPSIAHPGTAGTAPNGCLLDALCHDH